MHDLSHRGVSALIAEKNTGQKISKIL